MSKKVNDYEQNYIEEIFDFKGLWDMPSKCGLKVIEKTDKTVVIVTDLYHENPGTSITEFCTQLATIIAKEKNININKMIFIQHNPDLGSKYDFLVESFDLVKFEIVNNEFQNPKWENISKEDVEKIINE